ncbi:MAG: hypothetical protein D6702_06540 [Planctomycetota bacterium]|nr:MAG: hypothetical protein D6702_06540 [Planctomycetota bacterium]
MWRNILTGVAAVALCAGVSAQQTHQVKSKEGVNVQYLGTYSFAENSWTNSNRRGTRVLYNCTTPGNYYSTVGNSFATNADHLWIDEGVIADSNAMAIDQINGFDFAYCSSDLDPTGNSSSIRIVFYDDYVPCTTPPAATCDYIISGLPLSSTGNTQCWGVGVDLAGGFECTTDVAAMFKTTDAALANRSFGWAFGANPGLAFMNNTGPILDLPCATPILLNGCGTGNQNMFWWEDPAGVWSGCYWFGGVPWASFSMKMVAGSLNSFAYGYTNNTLMLTSTDFAAGSNVTFTCTGHNVANALYLVASPAPGSIILPAGELVVSTSFYPGVPFAMNSATGSMTASVPPVVQVAYVQAAETTGPATASALVALSNGLYCIG